MKTMQDFKNEESARQYSLLKKTINKPIGKLIKILRMKRVLDSTLFSRKPSINLLVN